MKTTNYRKIAMTLGGILIATVAAGCYGGGGSGYSNDPTATIVATVAMELQSYSGYSGGYSHPQSYGNSTTPAIRTGYELTRIATAAKIAVNEQHAA